MRTLVTALLNLRQRTRPNDGVVPRSDCLHLDRGRDADDPIGGDQGAVDADIVGPVEKRGVRMCFMAAELPRAPALFCDADHVEPPVAWNGFERGELKTKSRGMQMHDLSTSIGRDAWLGTLLDAFDSAECRCVPVSAQMIAAIEKHLRTDPRFNASVSPVFH